MYLEMYYLTPSFLRPFSSGIGGRRQMVIPRKYDHNLTLIINFNLLAHSEEDIENAYSHMYLSFMTNLSPDISAVLLSVTGKPHLKDYELVVRDNYRALIRKTLIEEGQFIMRNQPQHVNPFRLRYFWKNFTDMGDAELEDNLEGIANQVACEFMCIHRVSKVLKKCGQYQDLFLLSEGETKAYSYTNIALYSTMARPYNQPLFYDSEDVSNIHYRRFDYTLVMDNDTVCPPGTAQELLSVAAAHPERGIIQPSIKMKVNENDTIYMHLEMWRQRLNEPLSRSMAILYGQWGFYGKGMLKNKLYIEKMIGTRDKPIEVVPIDVLSHDTYEAAVLRPLYVDSLYFEEEPSYNYVTWHIRERRWNQGELILSRYFWPNVFGRPIDLMRKLFDKRNFVRTSIRTRVNFGLVSTHVAHSAVRSMFMKPMMLGYVFLQMGVSMHRPFLPLGGVLFLVCILPKFAITNWGNARFALLETLASIIQYTPEAFVGSIRLGQAMFATICKSCTENWTPQRVVEEDMRNSNPFSSSLRHLWGYSVVGLVSTIIFAVLTPEANLIFFMFATIMVMPIFTGITSLNPNIRTIRTLSDKVTPDGGTKTLSSIEEGCPDPRGPLHLTSLMNDPPDGPCYTPPVPTHPCAPEPIYPSRAPPLTPRQQVYLADEVREVREPRTVPEVREARRSRTKFSEVREGRGSRTFSEEREVRGSRTFSQEREVRGSRTFSQEREVRGSRTFSEEREGRGSRTFSEEREGRGSRTLSEEREGRVSRTFSEEREGRGSRTASEERGVRGSRTASEERKGIGSRIVHEARRSSRTDPEMREGRGSRTDPEARGSRTFSEEREVRGSRTFSEEREGRGSRIVREGRGSRTVQDMREGKGSRTVSEERKGRGSRTVSKERKGRGSRTASEERKGRGSMTASEERKGRGSRTASEERKGRGPRTVSEERKGRGSRTVSEERKGRGSRTFSEERKGRGSRTVSEERKGRGSRTASEERKGRGSRIVPEVREEREDVPMPTRRPKRLRQIAWTEDRQTPGSFPPMPLRNSTALSSTSSRTRYNTPLQR